MMCMPPIAFPNKPPEGHVFESRYTKARAQALGGPPRTLLAPGLAERQRPTSATELQRQIAEQARRRPSTWDGFPSFWHAVGALIMLALIALYVVVVNQPATAPTISGADHECELSYSPHLPLPFRYYPACEETER